MTSSEHTIAIRVGPVVDELRVIVLGDWGELLLNGQNRVAAAMANWSDTNEPAWIVSTGDNFYPNGIRAWDDPGVNLKWRNVYHIHESLVNLTWMISVGNHDYGNFAVRKKIVPRERGVLIFRTAQS